MHESGTNVTLPNGKLWGVAGASGWTLIKAVKNDAPHILIPTDELEGMSSEEIGASVLAMVTTARFCQAQDYAETFLSDPGFDYLSGNPEALLVQIKNAKEILIEFQGKDRRIDESLSLINRYEEEQDAKARLKTHKETHRRIASTNYEKLFFKLGKKYGFKCLSCGSVDSLEIDHIEPVSIGGSTELDNLQILCKKCNMQKGVQVIDYRSNEVY